MERSKQRAGAENDAPVSHFDPVSVDNDDEYNSFMAAFSATINNDDEQGGLDMPEVGFDESKSGKNESDRGHGFFHSSPPPAKRSRLSDKHNSGARAAKKDSAPSEELCSFFREELNRKEEPKQRWGHINQRTSHSSESPRQRAATEQQVVKGSNQEKTYRDMFNDWLEDQFQDLAAHLDELQDLRDFNGRYLEAFTSKARQVNDIYQAMKKEKMQILQTLDKIRATYGLRDNNPSASTDP